jgi:ADP-ribose pyrophosphatase
MNKVIPHDSVLIPDDAKLAYEGKIFSVYQWPQALFDGSHNIFEMLKRTDTVTAICITQDKILSIKDEQPHLGPRLSFPGGRVDDSDSDTLAAAKREILEETGYSFKTWKLVKVHQPYRKIEWFVYVYLATDELSKQEPNLDAGEKIEVMPMEFNELKELIIRGEGYLGESQDIFKELASLDDLIQLNEFQGSAVDR